MEETVVLKAIGLFFMGMAGIVKAIPVGVALKMSIFEIGLYVSLGSIATVFILFFFGEPMKKWLMKKWSKEKLEKRKGKFSSLLHRYGYVGVGILSPGILGPIPAIVLGLIVLKNSSKLMPYLVVGIIIWSYLLAWIAVTGFDFVEGWF